MNNLVIPQGYTAPLPNYEQQRAIAFIKESFQTNLSNCLLYTSPSPRDS